VEVVVHPDEQVLAAAIASRLIVVVSDAVASGGTASVVLTGGGIGTGCLAAVAAHPARDAVDWSRVDFWWGDERFVPSGDPERNETGARDALLDHIPADPARIHVMAASDGAYGADVDAAAAAYAAEVPSSFDVVMLGIGPEGHVASLFPWAPALGDNRLAVAVRDSPKPPPTRISLTFGPLRSAGEVWILASGTSKADAIAAVVAGTSPSECPAAGATGRDRTLLLADREAAAKLPA
jgi:6-phosphogluconolactonase